MAGMGKAQILVFELYKWLILLYEVKHCHNPKNSIYQHSSAFTTNSGFQLLFKYSTILCINDCLHMILVVLEDEAIKSRTASTSFCVTHTFEFLGPG